MSQLVLAFDIERSGATSKFKTIGIGASVVDSNFRELDRLFLPGFNKKTTQFEGRCWREFWSKHPEQLEMLEGKNSQRQMIREFQAFRTKWEDIAEKNKLDLVLCTDNNVYDGGFINTMIEKYTDDLPIPYNTRGQYSPFRETHSQQLGLLAAVAPEFKSFWGCSKMITKLYDVPICDAPHDHNPANDAKTIAHEQQVLFGIRDGRIKRKRKKKK